MSFELKQGESLRKGVRRIVRKQLECAQDALEDSGRESLDERIHSARKSFKRVRAVLRLVRYAVGRSAYEFENEAFRDAGRPLSEVRDAKILIEALKSLEKRRRTATAKAAFSAAKAWLMSDSTIFIRKCSTSKTHLPPRQRPLRRLASGLTIGVTSMGRGSRSLKA